MKALTSGKSGTLALVLAVACALVAVLLWWAGDHGSAVQAAEIGAREGRDRQVWADGFSPAWVSSEPVTYALENWNEPNTWPIPLYGVTIIFPGGSVFGSAVFTFTPELPYTMPPPLSSTPYYFFLEGEYTPFDEQYVDLGLMALETDGSQIMGPVSLAKRITITLEYDPAELAPVLEDTVDVYRAYNPNDGWVALDQQNSTVDIDRANDVIHMYTQKMQHFGIAGYRSRQFFPLITKEAGGTPSGVETGQAQD